MICSGSCRPIVNVSFDALQLSQLRRSGSITALFQCAVGVSVGYEKLVNALTENEEVNYCVSLLLIK